MKQLLLSMIKNYDAHYRLGLLCVTLQEFDNSFKHLNNALKLKKDHPKALYQMGVILFSLGRTKEAVEYLKGALKNRERSASIFLYLGMAYEKLDKLSNAEDSYERAMVEDPNDKNIIYRLKNIRIKNEKRKKINGKLEIGKKMTWKWKREKKSRFP